MARRLSKIEKLVRYRKRVEHARRWREDAGYDDTWRRLIDLYRGKHFPITNTDEDRIAVNLAFSTINVIFPSVSVNHPKITVQANKPEDEDRGVIVEAVVNYWWRHYDFRVPFRQAVKDFLMIGHGWTKVGYRFVEEERPLTEDELQREYERRVGEADVFAESRPDLAGDLPSDEEIAANLPQTKLAIVEDRPFVERVSPFDVYVDPEATSEYDMAWIAQRIVRPLEEVREDKRYVKSAREKVQPDASMRSQFDHDEQRKRDTDIQRVTVWEYYDLKNRSMCVFAENGDGYLIETRPIPYVFGHPFVMLRNYDVPDQFYPIGDLEQLETPQQELNKTRTQLMNARKKYGRKYLFRETAFSREGRQALESSEDNVMVPVQEDVPLQEVVVPMPQVQLAPDVYQYSDIIESDMDKISGVNEYARGATPEIRRTATEAAIIQDAANARAADKLAVVERAIAEIARKVVQLAQQFLTGEQVARVVGPNQAQLWVPFELDDIVGEYDFAVEGGSTQPNNETQRRQTAVAMMNALAPFVGQVIDPYMLVRHVLQDGFGIKNPDKFLMAMPPPLPPEAVGAPPPPGEKKPKGEPGLNGEQPPPAPLDPMGGTDAVPPELLLQLVGQTGMQAPTMGVG